MIPLLLALAVPQFHIEHIANAGVLLRCGDDAAIVDGAFHEGVAGYATLSPQQRQALLRAAPPFHGVKLLLATHRHKDHFDAPTLQLHLNANPAAIAAGPPQVAAELSGPRVWSLQPGDKRSLGAISLHVFRVPHNEPHDKTIENNVYLLTLCGKRVVITGDAILSPQAFRDAGLASLAPDIAVAPWWFALSARGREILDRVLAAPAYWAIHGDLAGRDKWRTQVLQHYPHAQIP